MGGCFAVVIEFRGWAWKPTGQLRGQMSLTFGGERIDSCCKASRVNRGNRKLLQSSPSVLVEIFKSVGSLAGTLSIYGAAFVVAYLLQPETGCRTVEQADEFKMLRIGRLNRQLDHRCSLLEDLTATVEHEMIMG